MVDTRINKLISWLDILIEESKPTMPPIAKRDDRIGRNVAWTILGRAYTGVVLDKWPLENQADLLVYVNETEETVCLYDPSHHRAKQWKTRWLPGITQWAIDRYESIHGRSSI